LAEGDPKIIPECAEIRSTVAKANQEIRLTIQERVNDLLMSTLK